MAGFIHELFRAFFQATLPLAVFSFALVWWTIKRGYFKGGSGVRALDREVKERDGNWKKRNARRQKRTVSQPPSRNNARKI